MGHGRRKGGLKSARKRLPQASFCMGDATDFDAWDQGISFFLNNMTWLRECARTLSCKKGGATCRCDVFV